MKRYFKILLILVVSSNLSFCQKKPLKECINENANLNNKFKNSDLNLFDSIRKYEHFLIKSKYLKGKYRKDYYQLINKKFNFKELKKVVTQIEIDLPFFYEFNYDPTSWEMMYNVCPFQVLSKGNMIENKYLGSLKIVYDRIFAEGYPNMSILEEVLLKTNFDDETTRLMMCNLIYINWLTLYRNEVYKNKRKRKE